MTPRSESVGNLRSNTLWAFAADGTQIVLTLLSFGLLSRFLGTQQFGLYSVLMSYCTLSALLGYMGAQQLLMLDLSAGGSFNELWSRLISTVLLGGTIVTVGLTLAQPLLLPEIPRMHVAAIAASQVVFFGLSEFALIAAQARRQMIVAFFVRLTSGLVRLAVVGLFITLGSASVQSWSWFALTTWAISGLAALGWVRYFFGSWPGWNPPDRVAVERGMPYVLGGSSATVLTEADRPMLKQLAPEDGDAAVGVYAVGYKLASFAAVPIAALVRASDYDFYAAGADGRAKAKKLAMRMTGIAASYGVIAGAGLIILAPLIDDVFGEEYAETQTVVRLLAPLALIKGLQIFPANALTGSGQQNKRNRALIIAVVLNLLANAILIPQHSWKGAIIATLLAESAMAAMFWGYLLRSLRGDGTQS